MVDPGHLLMAFVTAAADRDRAPGGYLTSVVQGRTGQTVELAYVGSELPTGTVAVAIPVGCRCPRTPWISPRRFVSIIA